MFINNIKDSLKILFTFTLLLGLAYPMSIYFTGQILFPEKANGSLYFQHGIVKGSFLIGQDFRSPEYFHPRPSAINYNPLPSGSSNLSLTSAVLLEEYKVRKKEFIQNNFLTPHSEVPEEMLFASGSGADPDISKESAYLQIKRIAIARNFNKLQTKQLINLVDSLVEPPQFGILGEEVVNVLKLNIKLDTMDKGNGKPGN